MFVSDVKFSSSTYHLAIFPLLSRQHDLFSLVKECRPSGYSNSLLVLGSSKDFIQYAFLYSLLVFMDLSLQDGYCKASIKNWSSESCLLHL